MEKVDWIRQIYLNGIKLNLGKYIGYLPQDIELFEGTISENIARFGEVDAKKVIDASMKLEFMR